MQEGYNPQRERRFQAMFDLLAAQLPVRFRALDLGCGPGSTSKRLLERFPRAHSAAIDFDPVVLRVGRGALGDQGGRLAWVEADLTSADWTRSLPGRRFDAAVSTTALHWLSPAGLRRLYRDLHRIVRPGGLVLNGDVMPFGPRYAALAELAKKVHAARVARGPPGDRRNSWDAWWNGLRAERSLVAEFAERDRRFPHAHHDDRPPGVDVHLRALRSAGFRTPAVVWEDLEDRIVIGLR